MNNRLKLYDVKLELFLEHKDKERLRKNAFKNKMTMSEYVRKLIKLDNELSSIELLNNKFDLSVDQINKISATLRRDI